MAMSAEDRFAEDARFAKIVSTADGPAILIGGVVIGIRSEMPHFHADGITRALRCCHRGEVSDFNSEGDSSQSHPGKEASLSTPPHR